MYYKFTDEQNKRLKIKEIFPDALTVYETYNNDIGEINMICRELNCSENDILLTLEQFMHLNSYEYR